MAESTQNISNSNNTLIWLKRGVWLYFYLLLFEGALRKWVLPGLSDALLIVRDPLAILLLFFAWKANILKLNGYITVMTFIGVASIITTFLTGHQNLFVTIYGARILLIQFPFIFLIGTVFDKSDVLQIGKQMLWIALPMTILITLQFYSPQSAWVNRGVGGDMEGAGFSGALGYFRPPGTFSFTNGNTFFYQLLACFILMFWLMPKYINKLILVLATICLVIAIPISISRTLLFSVIIALVFYFSALYFRPQFFKKLFLFLASLMIVGIIVSNLEFLDTATEAFTSRFENASESEGGLEGTLVDRYLGGFISAISNSQNIPFFGYGLGMGTNAGSQLLTGGTTFLIAEEEWARTIGEMGLILGLGVILIRVFLSTSFGFKSFKALKKQNAVPWMLLSFVLLIVPQGQWAQPTALGFAVFVTGLMIASFQPTSSTSN
ncbi:hypothetical protein [Maribacter aquivivus]|uniref:hypothetical protein n=1 Tax=Maribacter aquivivus TaxID=228958 RepID=UPI0024939EE2|nr:hypothetical protein [Maribacter aquivivus]